MRPASQMQDDTVNWAIACVTIEGGLALGSEAAEFRMYMHAYDGVRTY